MNTSNPSPTANRLCQWLLLAALPAVLALAPLLSRATPYASCISVASGTVSFYLNESNAFVTVTYDDNSTNASFNGITTGTNLARGKYSFSLVGHTNYTVTTTKTGAGKASIVASQAASNSRGIDVNRITNSPNFGQVYAAISTLTGTGYTNRALRRLNSDMTGINTNGAGVAWVTNSSSSPYRIAVNDDGYVTVGDFASAHSGVWRIDQIGRAHV